MSTQQDESFVLCFHEAGINFCWMLEPKTHPVFPVGKNLIQEYSDLFSEKETYLTERALGMWVVNDT